MTAPRLRSYGSSEVGTLTNFGRFGRLVSRWSDRQYAGLVKDGMVEPVVDQPNTFTLTDAGAHMVFHSHDLERGLDESLWPGWITRAEARAKGLIEPDDDVQIKVFRDGQVTVWKHPDEPCEYQTEPF